MNRQDHSPTKTRSWRYVERKLRTPLFYLARALPVALAACSGAPQHAALPTIAVPDAAATASAASLIPASPANGEDSFSWLEQSNAKTQEWERAANQRATSYLDSLPGFGDLLKRVKKYEDLPPPPRQVDVRGNVVFVLERSGDNRAKLVRRKVGEPSVTLFETSDADAQQHVDVDYFSASPLGRYVAIGTSADGREMTTVRTVNAVTGKDLGDRSEDVRLGQIAWYADDSGYLYMRGRGDKVPAIERSKDFSVAEHILGRSSADDAEVLGSRAPGARIGRDYDYLNPQTSYDGDYILTEIHHGSAANGTVSIAKRTRHPEAGLHWTEVYGETTPVHGVFAGFGHLFAVVPNGSQEIVEEVSFAHPGVHKKLFSSAHPIESVFELGHSLFAVQDVPTGHQIIRIRDEKAEPVTDSKVSASSSYGVDGFGRKAVFQFQSWTHPDRWYSIDGNGVSVPMSGDDTTAWDEPFETWETDAPARDGELIHLVLIGPKGDRSPKYVWMRVYGSYGVTIGPGFDAARRAFLDLGGTYVAAQVRGGGEKGQAWHEAGRGAKKIKTVEDTVDVVRFMRAHGFASGGGGIFAYGGSAGGIPIGGLLVREPGLIDGAAIISGVVNVTRFESTSATGPAQRVEFGNADTEEGLRLLRELDAFEGVRHGVAYPPTLLVTAANDFRVPYWESTKLGARLQQDTAGSSPILVHVTGGGHLGGRDENEELKLDVELLAFALSCVHNPSR